MNFCDVNTQNFEYQQLVDYLWRSEFLFSTKFCFTLYDI